MSRFSKSKVIPKLIQVLEQFKGHKELMLNVSRILSKVSSDSECSKSLIQTGKLNFLAELISEWESLNSFIVRIGFVLANLTTTFDEAREQVSNHISKIIKVAITYFKKDAEVGQAATGNKRDEMGANIEDTLVKLIRLIANICTDEQYMQTVLSSCGKDLIRDYMTHMIAAVERKKIAKSEELILNAVSCSTNLLFYDASTNESELFNNALRLRIFNATKMYILETSNEELQIEAVRVLSNLSRHVALC